MSVQLGPLSVTLHRTVRMPEGREAGNLPPSLGVFEVHKVADHKSKCPTGWDAEGVFVPLHDVEAMWLSFRSSEPVAILCGAGGVNALTGQKLGTKLEKDNYMVAPPQPWIDGWKDQDDQVYQFVGTRYQGGEGKTVGEQLLGKESVSGAIGLAVFVAKDRAKLKQVGVPSHGPVLTTKGMKGGPQGQSVGGAHCCFSDPGEALVDYDGLSGGRGDAGFAEMGVGKGGSILQKIYPDPHGLDVWSESPAAVTAIYFVDAKTFSAITGLPMPPLPATFQYYYGHYFKVADQGMGDVKGSVVFAGLESAFPGDVSNVPAKAEGAKS